MRAVALELPTTDTEALASEPTFTVDSDLAGWNDRMYRAHGTPYDRGLTAYIQQARVDSVLRLARISESDRVLELGCEAGQLMSRVPRCGRLVGADISGSALADAAERLSKRKPAAELVQVDAQRALPFTRGEFDVVICSEMLEHVAYPEAVIEQLHAIVDKKTRVVLSIPLEKPKIVLKRIFAAVGLLGLLFPGVEPTRSEWHLQSFSRRMLLDVTRDFLALDKGAIVWGCHYVARFTKR
jgi:2-polyprenyl-3-methyl-5-hydroxy-6-metoxy-1,4-benzoquinol methylase